MVMKPRILGAVRAGLKAAPPVAPNNQATAIRLGPAPLSMRGIGRDGSFVKARQLVKVGETQPVSAGAGLLGVISTPKASAVMFAPVVRVTGMLTAPPGAPEPPLTETVTCASNEAGQNNKDSRTILH